ncbi:hypothetical protein ACA910_013396 [Epithemia clementina (nom. ined.)]
MKTSYQSTPTTAAENADTKASSSDHKKPKKSGSHHRLTPREKLSDAPSEMSSSSTDNKIKRSGSSLLDASDEPGSAKSETTKHRRSSSRHRNREGGGGGGSGGGDTLKSKRGGNSRTRDDDHHSLDPSSSPSPLPSEKMSRRGSAPNSSSQPPVVIPEKMKRRGSALVTTSGHAMATSDYKLKGDSKQEGYSLDGLRKSVDKPRRRGSGVESASQVSSDHKAKRRGSGRNRTESEPMESSLDGVSSSSDKPSKHRGEDASSSHDSSSGKNAKMKRRGSGRTRDASSLESSVHGSASKEKAKRRGSCRSRHAEDEPSMDESRRSTGADHSSGSTSDRIHHRRQSSGQYRDESESKSMADGNEAATSSGSGGKMKRRGSNRHREASKGAEQSTLSEKGSKARESGAGGILGGESKGGRRGSDRTDKNLLESISLFPDILFPDDKPMQYRKSESFRVRTKKLDRGDDSSCATSSIAEGAPRSVAPALKLTGDSKFMRRNSAPFTMAAHEPNHKNNETKPNVHKGFSDTPSSAELMHQSHDFDGGDFWDFEDGMENGSPRRASKKPSATADATDPFFVVSAPSKFTRRGSGEPFASSSNHDADNAFPGDPFDTKDGSNNDGACLDFADFDGNDQIGDGSDHKHPYHPRPRRLGNGRIRQGATIVHRPNSGLSLDNYSSHRENSSRSLRSHRQNSDRSLRNHRENSSKSLRNNRQNSDRSLRSNRSSNTLKDDAKNAQEEGSPGSAKGSVVDRCFGKDNDDDELLHEIEDMLLQEEMAAEQEQTKHREQGGGNHHRDKKKRDDHGKDTQHKKKSDFDAEQAKKIALEEAKHQLELAKELSLDIETTTTQANMPRVSSTKQLPSSGIAMAILKH